MAIRFPDWIALDAAEHARISASAADLARQLEPCLSAFSAFEDESTASPNGTLDGMPYAAKDIFVSATRHPHGGLTQPLPIIQEHSTVLHLVDRAGARRIGYTAMTELAYEPSGYNAMCAAPKNPWNFDFITGGSSSGSAVAFARGAAVVALGADTAGFPRTSVP